MSNPKRLTASEAKSLSESTVINKENVLNDIHFSIRAAAEHGKRNQASRVYADETVEVTVLNDAIRSLTEDGYKAELSSPSKGFIRLGVTW